MTDAGERYTVEIVEAAAVVPGDRILCGGGPRLVGKVDHLEDVTLHLASGVEQEYERDDPVFRLTVPSPSGSQAVERIEVVRAASIIPGDWIWEPEWGFCEVLRCGPYPDREGYWQIVTTQDGDRYAHEEPVCRRLPVAEEPKGEREGYCPKCGAYMPMTLDGTKRVHGCHRTPPFRLPHGICACPVCGGYAPFRAGCWGTKDDPHDHAFMVPIHELVAARPSETEAGDA